MSIDPERQYSYRGPALKGLAMVVKSGEDTLYLDQKLKDMQSLKVYDGKGKFNLERAYKLILSNAKSLRVPSGYHYVLNVARPKNPRLELLPREQKFSKHYRSLVPLEVEQREERNGKKKKRGFQYLQFGKK